MIYSDYCFISKSGQVLAEESLPADKVGEFAQRLARRHQTTVYIWIAAGEPVAPDKCNCGATLPETGPCWNCQFPEEEAPAEAIPFQGEAFPAKVYSEFEEYF